MVFPDRSHGVSQCFAATCDPIGTAAASRPDRFGNSVRSFPSPRCCQRSQLLTHRPAFVMTAPQPFVTRSEPGRFSSNRPPNFDIRTACEPGGHEFSCLSAAPAQFARPGSGRIFRFVCFGTRLSRPRQPPPNPFVQSTSPARSGLAFSCVPLRAWVEEFTQPH